MGMALDESKEDDELFKKDEITFMINKDLFESAKPITVDYITTRMGSGFKLTSSLDAGRSCGTSCGSSDDSSDGGSCCCS
jgi:Fe-S cluster assembly iron-binding protein IscA